MNSLTYHLTNLVYQNVDRLLFRIAVLLRDVLRREAEYRYDCWQNVRYACV